MPLQIRRGTSSQLTSTFIPSAGEPVYATDTRKLYIGDGVSNGTTLSPLNEDVTLSSLGDVSLAGTPLDGQILQYVSSSSNWQAQSLSAGGLTEFSLGGSPTNGQVLRYDGNISSSTYGKYATASLAVSDLGDVDGTVTPANNYVLVYNSTSSKYVPQAFTGTISTASDVTITALANSQVLAWNAVSSKWVNQTISSGSTTLNGLTDVTLSTLADGQVLTYNSSTSQWINQAPSSGGSTTLTGLTDVTISTATNGQVLTYNSSTSQWVNQTPSSSSTTIGGLTDVTITSVSDGQALIYEAATSTWKNQTLSGGGAVSLDNLTDVSAGSPNNGDIIVYDSSLSQWGTVPNNLNSLTDVSAATPNNGDVITYDSSTGEWVSQAPSGGSGSGGLSSRTTASAATGSIADGASDNISITAAKTYAILTIQTSAAAWVTLYTTASSRLSDSSRSETTDPLPGSGVLAEVITTGATTAVITPGTIGFNNDAPEVSTVYAKVVNKSGSTQAITVTLGFVALEA